jgi:predicted  nucleic acid-binding Zn-ribbon protein
MTENELSMWGEVRDEKFKQAYLVRELIGMEDEWHNLSEDLAHLRAELANVELNLHSLRAEIDERFPLSPKKEY